MLSRFHYKSLFFALIVFASARVHAQYIKLDEETPQKQFPYISMVYDRIFNSSGMDSFYYKLTLLKKTKKSTLSIVHIGDSHVRSEYYPGVVKKGLQDFFGAGGKDSSGIIYNIIGQNGARFETFNRSSSFWQKLPSLKADLYIISLGTNDAQGRQFNEKDFHYQLKFMLDSLKKVSPGAAILFTTVADSFLNGYPNRLMWTMNISLYTYCANNNIPVWDLYRTTNGYGSAYNWIKTGMMDADGVHYTGRAYQVQGQLLFNAIARGYNNYMGSYK
jgi:lysophospholipase L1-like esterase